MKIDIHLTINEKDLENACEVLGVTREHFKKIVAHNLEEDMGETISDNWDLFEEKTFEID